MFTTTGGNSVRRSLRRRRTLDSMFSDEEGGATEDSNNTQPSSQTTPSLSSATRIAMGLPAEGTLRCVCGAGSSSATDPPAATTPSTVSVSTKQSSRAAAANSSPQSGTATEPPLSNDLVECAICFFCCHKNCVNVSGWSHVALRAFLCPFCAGGAFKRPRERAQMLAEAGHSNEASAPTSPIDLQAATTPAVTPTAKVKINEVKDRDPTPASTKPLVQQTLQALIDTCAAIKTTSTNTPATAAAPSKRRVTTIHNVDAAEDEAYDDGGYDLVFVPPLHTDSYLPNIPASDSDDEASAITEPPRTTIGGRRVERKDSQSNNNNKKAAAADVNDDSKNSPVASGGGGRRSIFRRGRNAEEATALLPEPPSMSASSPHHRPSSNPSESMSPMRKIASSPTATTAASPASGKMASVLTDTRISESIDCCQSAIENATFSDSYPQYILNELQQLPHQYLQGTFAVDRRSKKVVSLVITNGMDVYGNLKPTLSLLRSAMTRWGAADVVPPSSSSASPSGPLPTAKPPPSTNHKKGASRKTGTSATTPPPANAPSSPAGGGGAGKAQLIPEEIRKNFPSDAFMFNGVVMQPFMQHIVKEVEDVSGFVHFNLIATHTDHRGRGLAKRLMLAESLRWLLRGRTQAYLNMALERVRITPDGGRVPYVASPTITTPSSNNKNDNEEEEDDGNVICIFSEASRRLYVAMGFRDIYPRFDPITGESKWTPKEEEGGRVMANLDLKESSRVVASDVIGPDVPLVSGRRVLRLKSRK